ncbi:PASTA domain-containing protein [Arthrobacter castelli]|uniref:PASTA domain-containing protein n=1 Tax=Arthrobacter castelli TaxID=271431 RepID=UPI0003FE11AE|nr:PASTA domain-containing protein [Arthrobacter castelli]
MPLVSDATLAETRAELDAAGVGDFSINTGSEDQADGGWMVTEQSPMSGMSIDANTTVELTVHSAKFIEEAQAKREAEQREAAEAEKAAKMKAATERPKAAEKKAEQEAKEAAAKKKAEEAAAKKKAAAQAKKAKRTAVSSGTGDERVVRYFLESDAPIDIITCTSMINGETSQEQDTTGARSSVVKGYVFDEFEFGGSYSMYSFGVSGQAGAGASYITCRIEVEGRQVAKQTSTV